MWLRRLLLITMVACAAMSLPKARAYTVDLDGKSYEFQCPVSDGYRWRLDAKELRADRVHVSQVSPSSFNAICNRPWPAEKSIACAFYAQYDPTTNDNYSAILTMSPPSTMSEAVLNHELCHTQGWKHE